MVSSSLCGGDDINDVSEVIHCQNFTIKIALTQVPGRKSRPLSSTDSPNCFSCFYKHFTFSSGPIKTAHFAYATPTGEPSSHRRSHVSTTAEVLMDSLH